MAGWRTFKAEMIFRWWCIFDPRKATIEMAKADITPQDVEYGFLLFSLRDDSSFEPELRAFNYNKWRNKCREHIASEILHRRLEEYRDGKLTKDKWRTAKKRVIESLTNAEQ